MKMLYFWTESFEKGAVECNAGDIILDDETISVILQFKDMWVSFFFLRLYILKGKVHLMNAKSQGIFFIRSKKIKKILLDTVK